VVKLLARAVPQSRRHGVAVGVEEEKIRRSRRNRADEVGGLNRYVNAGGDHSNDFGFIKSGRGVVCIRQCLLCGHHLLLVSNELRASLSWPSTQPRC
jgi:hypothetical protein